MAEDGAPPSSVDICGKSYDSLADGVYDCIILGTGLKECVLCGLLSMKGMKVLQLDRNEYYGSETASLNLDHLFEKFRAGSDGKSEEDVETWKAKLGQNRDYNVDLVPKFILADGKLVKLVVKAGVADYLEFKVVDGSFVYKKGSGVHKMPATEMEAMKTSLMGFFQKRHFRNFLNYIAAYDQSNPSTHKGLDLTTASMRQLYSKFSLDDNSADFTGHAMALQFEDSYMDQPALPTVEAIKLYAKSLERYGKSPYIYPKFGIGGLPEAFSRKAAVNGGTFMLKQDIDEILFDNSGAAVGVRVGEKAASCKFLIGEPTYFAADKVRETGSVVRSICILDHPIKALGDARSAQIIIPQKQVGRANDIYISVMSSDHAVVGKGKFVAICSTTVETGDPIAELAPAFELIGSMVERFDNVVSTFSPVSDGSADKCYITQSYDASSHFETTSADLLSIYSRVTGEDYLSDGSDKK